MPRLRRAWRFCVRGAVFAAPAVVPGSGEVLLAEMDGVLHAFSVHGKGLCATLACAPQGHKSDTVWGTACLCHADFKQGMSLIVWHT